MADLSPSQPSPSQDALFAELRKPLLFLPLLSIPSVASPWGSHKPTVNPNPCILPLSYGTLPVTIPTCAPTLTLPLPPCPETLPPVLLSLPRPHRQFRFQSYVPLLEKTISFPLPHFPTTASTEGPESSTSLFTFFQRQLLQPPGVASSSE